MTARPLLALLALLAAAAPLRAQDSLIVLDPAAPAGDSVLSTGLPAAVLLEALARYNDSATTRFTGDVRLPRGTRISGPLGAWRGTTRLRGTVEGPVTVINGDLVLEAGAVVRGDLLVVGGRLTVDPEAVVDGERREYAAEAPVARRSNGTLAPREPHRSLTDLAAEATFERGQVRTTLRLATGGTYNRLEGLPLVFGPRVDWRPAPDALLRGEVLGILRTAGGEADLLSDLGVTGRVELRLGRPERIRLQLEGYSRVDPVSDHGLAASEVGWYALLTERDYRDYYDANGGGLGATWALAPQLPEAPPAPEPGPQLRSYLTWLDTNPAEGEETAAPGTDRAGAASAPVTASPGPASPTARPRPVPVSVVPPVPTAGRSWVRPTRRDLLFAGVGAGLLLVLELIIWLVVLLVR